MTIAFTLSLSLVVVLVILLLSFSIVPAPPNKTSLPWPPLSVSLPELHPPKKERRTKNKHRTRHSYIYIYISTFIHDGKSGVGRFDPPTLSPSLLLLLLLLLLLSILPWPPMIVSLYAKEPEIARASSFFFLFSLQVYSGLLDLVSMVALSTYLPSAPSMLSRPSPPCLFTPRIGRNRESRGGGKKKASFSVLLLLSSGLLSFFLSFKKPNSASPHSTYVDDVRPALPDDAIVALAPVNDVLHNTIKSLHSKPHHTPSLRKQSIRLATLN